MKVASGLCLRHVLRWSRNAFLVPLSPQKIRS